MTIDLEQFKGHTPGPWVAGTWLKTWDVEGPNGEEIAYFNDNIGVGSPQKLPAGPNAQLAAAAPALLSEVRRVKEALQSIFVADELLGKTPDHSQEEREARLYLALVIDSARSTLPSSEQQHGK
jgi:hypothetical protein